MAYANGRELVDDVLFRGGESVSQSDWSGKALDYLNRSYRTLAAGSSEFLPEYVDDWWWIRGNDTLLLEPVITLGTVSVIKDSDAISFSNGPAQSVAGWKLRVQGHPEIFTIATHVASATDATLDVAYTGEIVAAALYKLMKVFYPLDSAVQSLISPMVGYRGNHRIPGMSPERMDDLFPTAQIDAGPPLAFALEDSLTVRFSHGGLVETQQKMRVDYRYKKAVSDLAYDLNSVPLVPIEYRAVLSDMALTYLWLDKNDDRSNATALGARTMLAAMFKENRHRLARMNSGAVGHIYPRLGEVPGFSRQQPRTESGLLIG